MLILLTNDDGIRHPGLVAAYSMLKDFGEVVVVAPETVQSATGHGVTLSSPLTATEVDVQGVFRGTAVGGRPADCVKIAVANLLPRMPDLVFSGINSGANTGINVVYSGTCAAALEAGFLGLPALAVSLHITLVGGEDYPRCAAWTRPIVRQLLEQGLRKGKVLSVNLPGLPPGAMHKGVKVVRQCTRPWNDTYELRVSPKGQKYYWNSSVFQLGETDDDTDVAALRDGYVTLTPLQYDLTDYEELRRLSEGASALHQAGVAAG